MSDAGDSEETEGRRPKRGRRIRRMRRSAALVLSAALLCALGGRVLFRHPAKRLPPPAPQPTIPAPIPEPDPPGIVLHDSATPGRMGGAAVTAATLEEIHRDDHPDWATTYQGKTYHIGYHYVILPNGKVEQGRPDHCPGAHARRHNSWAGNLSHRGVFREEQPALEAVAPDARAVEVADDVVRKTDVAVSHSAGEGEAASGRV